MPNPLLVSSQKLYTQKGPYGRKLFACAVTVEGKS